MARFGGMLLILGIGFFILPAMGVQFVVMDALGPLGPLAAVVFIPLGAILMIIGVVSSAGRRPSVPVSSRRRQQAGDELDRIAMSGTERADGAAAALGALLDTDAVVKNKTSGVGQS